MALDWWIPKKSPAQLAALVDLETEQVWLFKHAELVEVAQQKPEHKDEVHFFFYTDPTARPENPGCMRRDYDKRLIDKQIEVLFGTMLNQENTLPR